MIYLESQMYNVADLFAGVVKMALLDALDDDVQQAQQARWWLNLAGMDHLLQRPEAQQFLPNARKRKSRKIPTQPAVALGA